mgnify:CR=1 FL=1
MSPFVRRFIILLSFIGFMTAAASTYVHYQLIQDPGYTSFCDINENVNCTQVYLSRFGSVGGIPVSLLGTFWFGLVLLLAMTAGRVSTELRENIGGYLLVSSTLGLAVVLFLGYASLMVIGTLCVLCGVVYVAVVGIFLLSGVAGSVPMTSIPRRLFGDLARLFRTPLALGVSIVYLALIASALVVFPVGSELVSEGDPVVISNSMTDSEDGSEFERYWNAQPRVELPIPHDGAQVLIIKFNDYECPSCAQTYLAYRPILARYQSSHPGAVRHVSLDFPLDPECNEQTPRGGHMGACEAAVAVRLARRANRDQEMAGWLYENQETLSRETIREALVEVAGMTDFDERYQETLEEVEEDIVLGGIVEIEATPTFVINGVMIKGGLQPQFFDAAIALELERTTVVRMAPEGR